MKLINYFIIRNGMEVAHSYFSPSSIKMSNSPNRLLFSTTEKCIQNIRNAIQ